MNIPELYRYGREGKWFGIRLFAVYMVEGIYQVCSLCFEFPIPQSLILGLYQSAVIYFLIAYTYMTESARPDGYQVGQFEFATVSFSFFMLHRW